MKKQKTWYKRAFKTAVSPLKKYRRNKKFEAFQKKLLSNADQITDWINRLTKTQSDKIIYIIQESFFDFTGENFFSGGGERYAQDLSNLLKHMGYYPILLQNAQEDLPPFLRNKNGLDVIGVPVYATHFISDIITQLPPAKLYIYSGVADFGNLHHPNIRISHGITWDVVKTNVKNITNLYDKFLKQTDTFISVDTNTLSWFRSTFSQTIYQSNKKMHYIPNYVDLDIFKPAHHSREKLKITFPRRCSVERGYWETVAILPQLLTNHKNVLFEFVGFPCQKEIVQDLERLKTTFPDQITHRVVEGDKMYQVYQNTDICIIPTLHSEGTSLSCLEAMASGNTVIATNIGGLPNLILQGYNGLLINPDSKELLSALETVITNKELRKKLAKNAFETSQCFSKKIWEQRWHTILKEILHEKDFSYSRNAA